MLFCITLICGKQIIKNRHRPRKGEKTNENKTSFYGTWSDAFAIAGVG